MVSIFLYFQLVQLKIDLREAQGVYSRLVAESQLLENVKDEIKVNIDFYVRYLSYMWHR